MVCLYKTLPPYLRTVVVIACVVILLFSFGLVAYAVGSGPSISGQTPAPGASLTNSSTTISFKVTDSDGIEDSSIKLKVNGTVLPVTITHPQGGHYETVVDSSCSSVTYEVWVPEVDYTQATVTASFNAADVNNVEVFAADKLGENSTTAWSFNCKLAPVISDISPANASIQQAVSVISAKVTDNGTINPASIVLKMNSNTVTHTYDPATGRISYTSATPLIEGDYDVYLEVKDTAGIMASARTTFRVAANSTKPLIYDLTPANGSTVTAATTNVSFKVVDSHEIASILVQANGAAIPFTVKYSEKGHYETQYDSCGIPYEVFVFDTWDYTQASVVTNSFARTEVTNVVITVKDKLGNEISNQYNYYNMQAPVISQLTPADGTVQKFITKVSAKATDNGAIDASSIQLKINSNIVPITFVAATGEISYISAVPLAPGEYNCELLVKDTAGNPKTAIWKFNVAADVGSPVISNMKPANNGKLTSTSTPFSFEATDVDNVDKNSVRILVNNVAVPASAITVNYPSTGHWEDRVIEDTCSGDGIDPPYTARVWVIDSYDYTKATISTNLTKLGDQNTVSIAVADALGNTTVTTIKLYQSTAPAFSAILPANNTWNITSPAKISVLVSDISTIDTSSIVLKVNGAVVDHTFTPSNATSGIVSYVPASPLSDGIHTAGLEVKDAWGNLASTSWRFGIGPGQATFSQVTPAAGSTFTAANPGISIFAADITNITSAKMNINGKPVTSTLKLLEIGGSWEWDEDEQEDFWVPVTDNTKATITYQPVSLPDGNNTVDVSVYNSCGGVNTYSWSFYGKVPPKISELSPANGAGLTSRTPTISAKLTDNSKIAGYKMQVDGKEVNAVFNPITNILSYTPVVPLTNNASHNVQLTVYDEVGGTATASTTFSIEIYASMPTSNCTTCHVTYPASHSIKQCTSCHRGTITSPVYHYDDWCSDCHDGGENYPEDHISCINCHSAPHSSISHKATADMTLCTECHSVSLTREHNRYKDSDGKPLTCLTCHNSTNNTVQQAIAGNKTNCSDCHTGAGAGHDRQHTDPLDSNCLTCHSPYLTQEHLNNPTTQGKNYDCNTCHDNTDKGVKRTIEANKMNCGGCHKEGHNVNFADSVPSDIPLYDGFKWSVPMEASLFAGEPTTPPDIASGQVVISNHSKGVSPSTITNFYKTELPVKGWTLSTSPAYIPANVATFVYGNRKVYVNCFSSTGSETGYRIQIWYK